MEFAKVSVQNNKHAVRQFEPEDRLAESSEPATRHSERLCSEARRFQLLDAVRGLAALAVVIYHSIPNQTETREFVAANPSSASITEWIFYILTCGYLGVPIFFMISGYCICAAAVNHREKRYPASRFFLRRIRRIYPPYWICIGICLLLAFVPGTKLNSGSLTVTQWLGNIFLFENYRHWFLAPESTNPFLGVSWTLCYEEQFYVLAGVILLLAPRALFPVFGILTAFVLLNTYNLNVGPLKRLGDLNSLQIRVDDLLIDAYWLFFAAGIGLFCYRTSSSKLRHLIPFLLVMLIFWEVRQLDWYTNRFATRVTTFSSTLLLCGLGYKDTYICALSWLRPVFWLGSRSYSIYLIHLPLVTLLGSLAPLFGITTPGQSLLIIMPLSTVIALLSGHWFYQHVERHWIPAPSPSSLL